MEEQSFAEKSDSDVIETSLGSEVTETTSISAPSTAVSEHAESEQHAGNAGQVCLIARRHIG